MTDPTMGSSLPPDPMPTETQTVDQEATEIGMQHIMRYLPAGTVMPDPPPAEVLAIAQEIGLHVLGRYDKPETVIIEGPEGPLTAPENTEPAVFDEAAMIQKAIEAIPPAPPPKTFQELKAEMEASLAAEAGEMTPEQQAAHAADQVRYTPPEPGPTFQEQVEMMNVEVVELTDEQKAEAELTAARYVPPPPPPTFAELKAEVDRQLEEQRQADLAKLLGQTPAA